MLHYCLVHPCKFNEIPAGIRLKLVYVQNCNLFFDYFSFNLQSHRPFFRNWNEL